MRIYSIFDDFDEVSIKTIRDAGGELTIHPYGVPRPGGAQLKDILEKYDCVIIGTGQKITEDMFDKINSPRVIATASVGLDHICIPAEKSNLVTVLNTPKANDQSVAEYTIGCALSCVKRLAEGDCLYRRGKNNKALFQKPEDLSGKTMGVVGAGNISVKIMEYAAYMGMKVICSTRNPEKHRELQQNGVVFTSLEKLASEADVISVNLPNNDGTKGIVSSDIVSMMKDNAVFISVSRLATVDAEALFIKAERCRGFYVCLDIDVDSEIVKRVPSVTNVIVTPHIAGGTVETRRRMFREVAAQIAALL